MKKIFVIFLVFTFSACASSGQIALGKVEFKKIDIDGKEFFFRYPTESIVSENSIFYDACEIKYGQKLEPIGEEFKLNKHEVDGLEYSAWYRDDLLVAYRGWLPALSYGFEVSDMDNGVEGCIDIVDQIVDSFSDKLGYVNEKYSFALDLPSDYEVEYLNDGLSLNKWVSASEEFDAEDPDDQLEAYRVEMVVLPFKNLEGYPDLGAFVEAEYTGFSIEFVSYEKVSGYYVDEGLGIDAVRHFFAMKGNIIYEAYIKLPSYHFPLHQQEFENLVKSMEIF